MDKKWTKIIINSSYGHFGSDTDWFSIYYKILRAKLRIKKIRKIIES